MARITVEDCIDKFPSRFELVLIASQRARKLYSGEKPTVEKNNDKNAVIALREIAETSIPIQDMKESLIEEYQTLTISDEENENLEIESSNIEEEPINEQIIQDGDSNQQIEEEIKNLVAVEDSNLEKNFEISEDLQSSENIPSSENTEEEDSS